jgi:hypothetical protein
MLYNSDGAIVLKYPEKASPSQTFALLQAIFYHLRLPNNTI